MILKKMLQFCKKYKTIEMRYIGNQKFLSCGFAMMNISNIAPEWNTQDCAIALDIDEDALDSYTIVQGDEFGGVNNVADTYSLIPADRLRYSMNVDGDTLQPFKLSNGNIAFVKMEYLTIFKGENNKAYKFQVQNESIKMYIFNDGLLIGMINPTKTDMASVYRFAKIITECAKTSFGNKFLDIGGQVSLEDMEEKE